jgi:5-methylcytosine-specific restriction protein A
MPAVPNGTGGSDRLADRAGRRLVEVRMPSRAPSWCRMHRRYYRAGGCPACTTARKAKYGGAWPKLARAAVTAHRARFGDWCPGYGRAAHAATDLTANHRGRDPRTDGITVLCRSCNARLGNRSPIDG